MMHYEISLVNQDHSLDTVTNQEVKNAYTDVAFTTVTQMLPLTLGPRISWLWYLHTMHHSQITKDFVSLYCMVFNIPRFHPMHSYAQSFMLHNPACAGNDILVDTPVVGSLKL
jgi:hypothetical protein